MRALFLGGTKGLGQELAKAGMEAGFRPVIVGRSAPADPKLQSAPFIRADMKNPYVGQRVVEGLSDISSISFVFVSTGFVLKGSLNEQWPEDIIDLWKTIVVGPALVIRELQKAKVAKGGKPYHLVTIASTTAYKIREDETAYATAMAARAAFAKNFHRELTAQLPKSRSTLVIPGGMKTGFWDNLPQIDTSNFLDPSEVAREIWQATAEQKSEERDWSEVTITRDGNVSVKTKLE